MRLRPHFLEGRRGYVQHRSCRRESPKALVCFHPTPLRQSTRSVKSVVGALIILGSVMVAQLSPHFVLVGALRLVFVFQRFALVVAQLVSLQILIRT